MPVATQSGSGPAPGNHSAAHDRGTGRTPIWLLVPAVVAVVFLVAPLTALVLRADWLRLPHTLSQPAIREALWLSIWTSSVATALALVLGVPLAWVLAKQQFPGKSVVRALVTLPLVLPPVVAGVALLMFFGRRGVFGQVLDATFGVTIPFTSAAVILAQTFVSMPFLIITVEGALRLSGRHYEEAAATLGATRFTVFRRVTLPVIASSLMAGAVLCWARALGEFGATITFAGSFPGRTQTMPVQVYSALESDPQAAIALSLVLLLVCGTVLIGLRKQWLRTP